ncbi:hypothetical protein A9Q84_14035 [Halobacteriovorax marinus]|uniref:Outer membrane protein beta-barrel domain-containing protein n=1 Tax=Halobacteriovorax marinus TaxID=97084 RepID=A0A1Y5FD99_9BACT|nr:hypothetical protein A9Q84_14035 [Halobacteriovorax marinus]
MKVLLTLFILIVSTQAAQLPPKWRLEYNYGLVESKYKEFQDTIVFTPTNTTQQTDYHQFIFQYYFLPPWIDFSMGLNTTGTNTSKPEDETKHFQYFTAFMNLGFVLPISDYWNFKLVVERFFTTMIVPGNKFGFRNLTGNQIYPEVEWLPFGSDIFFQMSPYIKFPIWSDIGGRKETTAGLKFKFPLGSARNIKFPAYAYQTSILLKFFYSKMELTFERPGFISSEISIEQIGATIGFNF